MEEKNNNGKSIPLHTRSKVCANGGICLCGLKQRPDLMSDVGEIDLTFGNVVSQTASSSSSPAFSPLVPPKMVFDAGDYLPSLVFGKTFSFFISTL